MTFFTQGFTYKSASTNIPPQTSHWQPPAVVLPSTPQYDGTLILTIHTYDSADMFSPYLAHYSRNYQMPRRSAYQLLLRCRQLRRCHLHIPHSLQFFIGQFQTGIHIFDIRTEIDTESSCIGIRSQIGLYIIYQSSAREAIHSAYCSCPDRQAHYSADKVPYAYHHTHCIPGYQSLHAPDEYL